MKNMKRALSLVLTMVMLLGMVMIPTGAVSNFADADRIENKEAVAITSGIGLFAGTSDGNFAPKASVTRAQMATIIVKMLRGNEFNADAFKGVGVNPFPDTASFEGGWAEGYINACSQLGVVAGYGDGTFKPGRELTTAEALTMIINALGIDPGAGEWPTNYMAKAEELKLYGDLTKKPGTNEPLSRDQLAVIVWEGMKYSPAGSTGYSYTVGGKTFTFKTLAEAIDAIGVANIGSINEVIGEDSLASKVYEVKNATGWITGNTASGEECTVLTRANGEEELYGVETGVDLLGHYVTIYYREQFKNEEEPGEVYTVVDESTVVTVSEAISTTKKYKEVFGKSIEAAANGMMLSNDYTVTEKLSNDLDEAVAGIGYVAGSAAPKGTYVIANGAIVAYIAPVAVYASYVFDMDAVTGNETVWLSGADGDRPIPNAEGDDMIVEYDGMKIGDFVTYIRVQDTFVVSPVAKVTGTVTKTASAEVNGEDYETITIDGTTYPAFEPKGTSPSKNDASGKLDTRLANVNYGQTYSLYVTEDGHYIGFEAAGSAISMDNTVFLLGTLPAPVKEKDQYGKITFVNKVRGIDMEGNEVMMTIGKTLDVNGDGIYTVGEDPEALGNMDPVLTGYYTYELSTDKDEKKEEIQVLTPYPGGYSPESRTYTVMGKTTSGTFTGSGSITTSEGIPAYGTSRMKFFAVDGSVSDSAPLTVSRPSGIQIDSSKHKYYVLVTRADDGSSDMEAFIYLTGEKMGETVYFRVTQDQIDTAYRTSEGAAYTVYSAATGKETEIILDPNYNFTLTTPGMYSGKKDGDGLFYEIESFATSSPVRANYSDGLPQIASDMGFWGYTGSYLRGERMASSDGGAVNMMMNGWTNNANTATVVDLRTEEEIESSGVPKITGLDQLNQLRDNDPGLVVVYDAYVQDNASSTSIGDVKTVFVTAAYRRTVGLNSVVYVNGSPNSGDTVIAVRSSTAALGESVKVTFDVTEDAGSGFYRFGVIAGGKLALLPFDEDVIPSGTYGNFGMIAMHNAVDSVELLGAGAVKLMTSDAHSNCTFKCVNSSVEAVKEIDVTKDTIILDVNGNVLKAADLATIFKSSDLIINYYCDTPVYSTGAADLAERDTSAELIVIDSKAPLAVTCDGDHTGMTPVTGSSITASGSYYLTGDMSETLTISADNVTLCMNTHSIRPVGASEHDSKSAVVVRGTNVKLVSCGRPNSQLIGLNAPAVDGTCSIDENLIEQSSMVYCNLHGWHDDGSWKPLTGAVLANGKYYLSGDTTVSEKITVSGSDVTLCLGSKTLSAPASDLTNFIEINKNAKLTIVADEGGTIAGGGSAKTRGIATLGGGSTLVLQSGTITGFRTDANGAAVSLDYGGTFNMTGGTIAGNYTAKDGGAVLLNNNAVFTMTGGVIGGDTLATASNLSKTTGNYAGGSNGGGAICILGNANYPNAKAVLNGGEIKGNATGKKGGAVFAGSYTAVELNGAEITGNKASGNGGGIGGSNTTVTMTGGCISNNITAGEGGGIHLDPGTGGTFKMSAGEVSGNTAAKDGGGIMAKQKAVVIISGGKITGNTGAPTNYNGGGGVAMFGNSSFTMTGGEISNNTALTTNATAIFGGGLFIGGNVTKFEMSGGTISGNTLGGADSGLSTRKVIEISGGAFDDRIEPIDSKTITVSGGRFSYDPSAVSNVNLAAGKTVVTLDAAEAPYTHEVK